MRQIRHDPMSQRARIRDSTSRRASPLTGLILNEPVFVAALATIHSGAARRARPCCPPSGREMTEGAAGQDPHLREDKVMNRFAAASGVVLCAALAIANAHATDGRILMV